MTFGVLTFGMFDRGGAQATSDVARQTGEALRQSGRVVSQAVDAVTQTVQSATSAAAGAAQQSAGWAAMPSMAQDTRTQPRGDLRLRRQDLQGRHKGNRGGADAHARISWARGAKVKVSSLSAKNMAAYRKRCEMRELAKSAASYTWAMSVFGVQQAANVLALSNFRQAWDKANAAFYSVNQSAQIQFGDIIFAAYEVGDEVQRGLTDLFRHAYASSTQSQLCFEADVSSNRAITGHTPNFLHDGSCSARLANT